MLKKLVGGIAPCMVETPARFEMRICDDVAQSSTHVVDTTSAVILVYTVANFKSELLLILKADKSPTVLFIVRSMS